MWSKNLAVIPLTLALLTGCDQATNKESNDAASKAEKKDEPMIKLKVFAAASLTESLTSIAQNYKKMHPNIEILFNFDSSGTLKRQISEGAESDLFISAAPKQMNELATEQKIKQDSRIDLLENKVTLVSSKENKYQFDQFANLKSKLSQKCEIPFAIGNSDVPVGQYSLKIFSALDLKVEELEKNGCISYGSNVKEVTTQVSENMVMAGIVYATDAVSADLKILDVATEELCGKVIYPAAILQASKYPKETQEFLNYLSSDLSKEIFEKIGFTLLKP